MVFVCICANGNAQKFADSKKLNLIQPRMQMPVILIDPNSSEAEKFAAKELQTYLSKITKRDIAILKSKTEPNAKFIVLGRHSLNDDLNFRNLNEEEYIIDITESCVRIVGGRHVIANRADKDYTHERGTIYGVYEFLENLGVRWYRPEEWGEHIPEMNEVVLPIGRQFFKPAYKYRYGMSGYRWWRDETMEQRKMGNLWALRLRQNTNLQSPGGCYNAYFSHAYNDLVSPSLFSSNPEFFALIDGHRSGDPGAQLCLGNPELQKFFIKRIIDVAKSRPNTEIFSVEPSDTSLWCQCDLCTAMDDPNLKNGYGGVSMANRVCAFNNIVACALAKEVPGASIGWLAYHDHTEVPTYVKKLESNTYVQATAYAGAYSDYSRNLEDPDSIQNRRFVQILKGYGNLTKIFAHDYFSGYAWAGPMPIVHTMVDRLRNYRKYNVVGVYSETHQHWGPQGLNLYMYGKLLWNPDLDVDKELDLYYANYYGPAASIMKQYHESLEKAAQGGVLHFSGGAGIDGIFSDKLLKELEVKIQKSMALVKGKSPYEQRLHGVWAGYEYARRWHIAKQLKDACRHAEAIAEANDLIKFVHSYPDGNVFDNGTNIYPSIFQDLVGFADKVKEQAQLLDLFKNPRIAQDISKQWSFKTDPDDKGIVLGWMKAQYSDTDWSLLDADRWWQEQGYSDYHGVAWYRKVFNCPQLNETDKLLLYFGAVDGDAEVYLNGDKIGTHDLGEGAQNWDKPFYFDISDSVKKNKKNTLVVRVRKMYAMSGIFKGVRMLYVN